LRSFGYGWIELVLWAWHPWNWQSGFRIKVSFLAVVAVAVAVDKRAGPHAPPRRHVHHVDPWHGFQKHDVPAQRPRSGVVQQSAVGNWYAIVLWQEDKPTRVGGDALLVKVHCCARPHVNGCDGPAVDRFEAVPAHLIAVLNVPHAHVDSVKLWQVEARRGHPAKIVVDALPSITFDQLGAGVLNVWKRKVHKVPSL